MIKLSLNDDSQLEGSINRPHILGDFIFVSCPVYNEYIYYSDVTSLKDSDDKELPEDFVFIPGPKF